MLGNFFMNYHSNLFRHYHFVLSNTCNHRKLMLNILLKPEKVCLFGLPIILKPAKCKNKECGNDA